MKKEKPKFDEKKFIELCNQREMKMYELRKKGVPFSQRLREVLPISIQISSMTLGEKAEEFEKKYIELHEQKEKAEEEGDEDKVRIAFNKLDELCINQDSPSESEKEIPSDKEIPIFKLIDATGINGVPNVYVNGKEKFKRLMIQKIGYKKHIKDDIYEAVIFDEAPLEKGQKIFL